jgi:hypothetical protein
VLDLAMWLSLHKRKRCDVNGESYLILPPAGAGSSPLG